MTPEEAFALLLQKCREDYRCARSVERLFAEYNLPDPNFGWQQVPTPCVHPDCPTKEIEWGKGRRQPRKVFLRKNTRTSVTHASILP